MKGELKAFKIMLLVLGSILVVPIALSVLFIGIIFLVDASDYIFYKHNVTTKEEMLEMFYEYQEDYEQVVQDAEKILENSNKKFLYMERPWEYKHYGLDNSLVKKFPIYGVSVEKEEEGFWVKFIFVFCPKPYTYWGIYYTERDEPDAWEGGKLDEINGIFVEEVKGRFRYETERIKENWFYYQCWTR